MADADTTACLPCHHLHHHTNTPTGTVYVLDHRLGAPRAVEYPGRGIETFSLSMAQVPDLPETLAAFRAQQQADPEFGPLLRWLQAPSPRPVTELQPRWASQHEHFTVRDGVLYRRYGIDKDHVRLCLAVPATLRGDILRTAHVTPPAHRGVTKTTDIIRQVYWWPNLHKHVVQLCRACISCRTAKATRNRRVGLSQIRDVQRPGDVWFVDHVGPLAPDAEGYRYALTFVCGATGYLIWVPTRTVNAQEAVDALLDRVVYQHGVPLRLISDNGSAFVSALWSGLEKALGIKITRVAPYHAASNGAAERPHRDLNALLKILLLEGERPGSWTRNLQAIAFAINTSIVARHGYAHHTVYYGRAARLPVHRMYGPAFAANRNVSEFFTQRREEHSRIWDDYLVRLEAARQQGAAAANIHRKQDTTKVGDYVFLYRDTGTSGTPKRYVSSWTGPWIVKAIPYPLTLILTNASGTTTRKAHLHNTLPYTPLPADHPCATDAQAVPDPPVAPEPDGKNEIDLGDEKGKYPLGSRALVMLQDWERPWRWDLVSILAPLPDKRLSVRFYGSPSPSLSLAKRTWFPVYHNQEDGTATATSAPAATDVHWDDIVDMDKVLAGDIYLTEHNRLTATSRSIINKACRAMPRKPKAGKAAAKS